MSKKEFNEFISKQTKVISDEKSIDWDFEKDEWLQQLSKFYKKVEGFLEEYLKNKKVLLNYTEKEIFEEYIGSYSVKVLNIELGNHKIKFEPIGTNLIGAKGRVDLIGANGQIKFILVDKNLSAPNIKVSVWIKGEELPEKNKDLKVVEWDWKIATSPPGMLYINLDEDTFLDALMEVVGG